MGKHGKAKEGGSGLLSPPCGCKIFWRKPRLLSQSAFFPMFPAAKTCDFPIVLSTCQIEAEGLPKKAEPWDPPFDWYCRCMINDPILLRAWIPIINPIKGRGFIKQGSTLALKQVGNTSNRYGDFPFWKSPRYGLSYIGVQYWGPLFWKLPCVGAQGDPLRKYLTFTQCKQGAQHL